MKINHYLPHNYQPVLQDLVANALLLSLISLIYIAGFTLWVCSVFPLDWWYWASIRYIFFFHSYLLKLCVCVWCVWRGQWAHTYHSAGVEVKRQRWRIRFLFPRPASGDWTHRHHTVSAFAHWDTFPSPKCKFSLEKCLFQSSTHFPIRSVVVELLVGVFFWGVVVVVVVRILALD